MPEDNRYSRQVVLPEIGPTGQRKLDSARVAVVGLGALGGIAAGLLARAGVGRLRLVDRDVVERSNLQRQLLYDEDDVDLPKADVAARKLRRANPDVAIEGVAKDLNFATAEAALKDADVIVDGTDNMETRFLINEAAIAWDRPYVYAGTIGTGGMVFAVAPRATACLRCFVPVLPAPGSLPTCDTAGVLNSVAAAVAGMETTEAIKLLLGHPPSGELLVFDGWANEVERLRIVRRRDCPACVQRVQEFLGARRGAVIASVCGSATISIDPVLEGEVDLAALAERLRSVAKVRGGESIIVADVGGCTLTVFRDGRALIRGTDDEARARSLYARFVGY